LKYRNYGFVSNKWIYNMLMSGTKVNYTDISYRKPNISQVSINRISHVFKKSKSADLLELPEGYKANFLHQRAKPSYAK
jgi:hypothetical protein